MKGDLVNNIEGRVPPCAVDAEESILTSILIDGESIIDVVDILTADDFYKPSHVKIFQAMSELFSESESIDIITCANKLKTNDSLESIGGASYLSYLMDSVPLSTNLVRHSEIVKEKSHLRKMIQVCSGVVNECMESKESARDIIDKAESSIYDISSSNVKPSFYDAKSLLLKNIQTIEERQNSNSELVGLSTGFTQIDYLTSGLQKTDLIILAARPSMGKTALALNIARNVAVMEEKMVAIFSLEMGAEQLSMRLLQSESRINGDKIKQGNLNADEWEYISNAANIIGQAKIKIDDAPNISSMELKAKLRRILSSSKAELGLIIVDYIQLMKSTIKAGERRDLEIGEITRSLKGIAKDMDVPVIGLSQLNRALEQRADKRPVMSDLRESGAIEQDADIIAFIYRDEVYNKDPNNPNKGGAEIIIAKNRNGATGVANLSFVGKYTRFENREMYRT